jgi:hypothetical protein
MTEDKLNTRADLLHALNNLDEWPEYKGKKMPMPSQWIADLIYHLAVNSQLPDDEKVCAHACANLGIPFDPNATEKDDERVPVIRRLIWLNRERAERRIKAEKHAAMLAAGWSPFDEEILVKARYADRHVLVFFPRTNYKVKCKPKQFSDGMWAMPPRCTRRGYRPDPEAYAQIIYTERGVA